LEKTLWALQACLLEAPLLLLLLVRILVQRLQQQQLEICSWQVLAAA
jgi:hypothetical protein